ncbi:uncharacterized protein J3D65DRAFT_638735, partial [Phyllosticta citribraziliensis]
MIPSPVSAAAYIPCRLLAGWAGRLAAVVWWVSVSVSGTRVVRDRAVGRERSMARSTEHGARGTACSVFGSSCASRPWRAFLWFFCRGLWCGWPTGGRPALIEVRSDADMTGGLHGVSGVKGCGSKCCWLAFLGKWTGTAVWRDRELAIQACFESLCSWLDTGHGVLGVRQFMRVAAVEGIPLVFLSGVVVRVADWRTAGI